MTDVRKCFNGTLAETPTGEEMNFTKLTINIMCHTNYHNGTTCFDPCKFCSIESHYSNGQKFKNYTVLYWY